MWQEQKPGYKQRRIMFEKCGKKCFLGTKSSFPICTKNTCKINREGVMAAYKRAREYMSISKKNKSKKKRLTYTRIANRAKKMMK